MWKHLVVFAVAVAVVADAVDEDGIVVVQPVLDYAVVAAAAAVVAAETEVVVCLLEIVERLQKKHSSSPPPPPSSPLLTFVCVLRCNLAWYPGRSP